MAIVTAVKSGNWSDPTVWNTGALPQVGDTARPGAYVVTIDQDIEVQLLGAALDLAGYFRVNTGVTICANIDAYGAGSLPQYALVALYHPSGSIVRIYGNITGCNQGSSRMALRTLSSGGLDIVGNMTGGYPGQVCHALYASTAGDPINVTGDFRGGGTTSYGAYVSASRKISVVGNLFASDLAVATGLALSGSMPSSPHITGNVYATSLYGGLSISDVVSAAVYIDGDAIPYDDGVPWPTGKWKEAIRNVSTTPVVISGEARKTSQGFDAVLGPFFLSVARRQYYIDVRYIDPATEQMVVERYRAGVNPQLTATVQLRPRVVCTVKEGR